MSVETGEAAATDQRAQPMARAGAYVRVSLEREGMISPELQMKAISEYCALRDYEVVRVIEDLDLGGRFWKTMITQCSGQPLHERGKHGAVRPVHVRSWVGAPQHSDLVAQHEEFDILGGGHSGEQQEQPEHLLEDQVEQAQRHAGITSDRRSPLASGPGPTSGTPHRLTMY